MTRTHVLYSTYIRSLNQSRVIDMTHDTHVRNHVQIQLVFIVNPVLASVQKVLRYNGYRMKISEPRALNISTTHDRSAIVQSTCVSARGEFYSPTATILHTQIALRSCPVLLFNTEIFTSTFRSTLNHKMIKLIPNHTFKF